MVSNAEVKDVLENMFDFMHDASKTFMDLSVNFIKINSSVRLLGDLKKSCREVFGGDNVDAIHSMLTKKFGGDSIAVACSYIEKAQTAARIMRDIHKAMEAEHEVSKDYIDKLLRVGATFTEECLTEFVIYTDSTKRS